MAESRWRSMYWCRRGTLAMTSRFDSGMRPPSPENNTAGGIIRLRTLRRAQSAGPLHCLVHDVHSDQLAPRLEKLADDASGLALPQRKTVHLDHWKQAVRAGREHGLLRLVEIERRVGAFLRLEAELLGELDGGEEAHSREVRPALRNSQDPVGHEQEVRAAALRDVAVRVQHERESLRIRRPGLELRLE